MKKILCLGDACADVVIPFGAVKKGLSAYPEFTPGGTAANTASALARLSVPCAFLGKAGNDYFGKEMKTALQKDGADVTHFTLDSALSSTLILVVLDEENERYPFLMPRKDPAHLYLYRQDLPESLLDDCDFVHTTGLMLFENPAAEAVCSFLELCKKKGVPVSLDINLRVETQKMDTTYLRRALNCTTYLFGSAREELQPLTGEKDAESAARSLVTKERVVISRMGAEGATVYTQNEAFFCGAYKVSVADTLGAGDCYNSGFLLGLYEGASLAAANRLGCAAAALNLTKPGARNAPSRVELAQFLASRP